MLNSDKGSDNESLLDPKETTINHSFLDEQLEDPIQQYNYVIHHYNFDECQVNNTKLSLIRESGVYHKFWKVYCKPWLLITFLACVGVPGVGLFVYFWLMFGILSYLSGVRVFNSNRSRVADPFQNMIFSPELCRITNSLNKFFDIKIRDLEGFSFNSEVINTLKMKGKGDKLKFMIYSGKFWDFYNNFPKYRGKYLLIWLVATALLAIQAVFIDLIVRAAE